MGENKEHTLIVLTGDIMHSKTELSPESIDMAQDFFINLSNIAPVIMIAGNHDCNLANRNRMDALTPLIKRIHGAQNLHYLKDSGLYQYHNIIFGVTSLLDNILTTADNINKNDWKNIKQQNKYKIALYHGSLKGSTTDTGFMPKNTDLTVKKFDGYDYVMLGDVHKYQYMNKEETIAYPGSLIQQNHGETLRGHGILKWNLPKKTTKFIEITNDYGYCTINIKNGKIIKSDDPKKNEIPQKAQIKFIMEDTNEAEYKKICGSITEKKNGS
jgi:DNA repair exonuclease SbcCD nuclease subunit